MKYLFVTTIEACIDIAQHVCSAESHGAPTDNGDATRRLGNAGIIKAETATAMMAVSSNAPLRIYPNVTAINSTRTCITTSAKIALNMAVLAFENVA